ncbi:hypothetical protein EZS27_014563 [termite gut metagenome]|uniref:Uncharacterized protein n=2 Tax=termite gut metagenome TaxID=433724 RepID=A0A5J4RV86_9ZZZZ
MIRTIIIPDNHYVTLSIPEKYIGKELEVIVFPKEEIIEKTIPSKVTFTDFGLNISGYKFNREEANER